MIALPVRARHGLSWRCLAAWTLVPALQSAALAQTEPPPNPPDCITAAAAHHQVSPYILRAIAWQESRLNPAAVNRNTNGSIDYGAMQINSIHLKRLAAFGVDAKSLMDPCVSAYVGAWLLRQQFEVYGHTWKAVGAYHSRTPALNARYAAGVRGTLERWGVQMALK